MKNIKKIKIKKDKMVKSMTEDENIKKYIASINKLIKSGNPKYLAYISKEYMKLRTNNKMVSLLVEDMIKKEATLPGSVYAVFIDNDNSINLDVMNDISKITNLADFIKNINALSEQNVDFGELTSDELIIEGMEIAEKLAKEVDKIEENINYDDYESLENIEENVTSEIQAKTDGALKKVTAIGVITLGVKAIIENIKGRIGSIISKVNKKKQLKNIEKKNEQKEETVKLDNTDFIQKVNIDEKSVINQMKESKNIINDKRLEFDNMTDDSSDDDPNDDTNNDENNTQEDDEPDI